MKTKIPNQKIAGCMSSSQTKSAVVTKLRPNDP